ncbi:MAG: phosphoribosylanthranilate isomerase [Rhodospirillales bacterium]
MSAKAKICGLNDLTSVRAAVDGGAAYVGFVFFPPSPRSLKLPLAGDLARAAGTGVIRVGLFVNPDDDLLKETLDAVPLDMIQLHGKETPDRVAAVRSRFGKPVMKACGISSGEDIRAARAYLPVADRILFDAKPPKRDDALPGGNAETFDWSLLTSADWPGPWMLAGGLDAENVASAIRQTRATDVDISSGVEDKPGRKNPEKIRLFLKAVAGR